MLDARLHALFQDYADGHRHPTNRLTHKIAIPLIAFHVIAMLDWVRLVEIPGAGGYMLSLGHLGWVAAVGWYLTMNVRLALLMALFFAACFPIAAYTPVWAVVAIAIVAWSIQLAGHSIWEKNRPAFLKNMAHALIGPLFFMAILTGDWPPKPVGVRA
ncbi:MAG: DUF962 domain-containing protein [Pseudomonadota bacterium]|nr:DUF962 domain-containing protein [Pseudomonadota bacterium]